MSDQRDSMNTIIAKQIAFYPKTRAAFKEMLALRIQREKGQYAWPAQVYVPSRRLSEVFPANDIVKAFIDFKNIRFKNSLPDMSMMTDHEIKLFKAGSSYMRNAIFGAWVLGTWSMSKAVYQFDPDVYGELVKTPIDQDMPIEVFERLPHWGVYVEAQKTEIYSVDNRLLHNVVGFWLTYDYMMLDGENVLCLSVVLNEKDQCFWEDDADVRYRSPVQYFPFILPLKKGFTFGQAMRAGLGGIWQRSNHQIKEFEQSYGVVLSHLMPVVLWLCSKEPDISAIKGCPERFLKPKNPDFYVVKGGYSINPPDKVCVYKVAQQIGGELRQARARQQQADAQGQPVERCAHIRKAHWHGYWYGKEGTEKTYQVKWVASTLVSATKVVKRA